MHLDAFKAQKYLRESKQFAKLFLSIISDSENLNLLCALKNINCISINMYHIIIYRFVQVESFDNGRIFISTSDSAQRKSQTYIFT